MKHIWKQKAKCSFCGGTGIYRGFGERKKVGVQCRTCNGTGCEEIKIEWEDFEGRIKIKDIKRVVEINPGIIVDEDPKFGGMPYEDWFNGKPFPPKSENRGYCCPAWWYQCMNYRLKPDWDWCSQPPGRGFFSCPRFKNKDRCWERWDKEFGGEQK